MTDEYFNPRLQTGPETVRTILAKVIAVIPEYNQAELVADDGSRYALTAKTAGIATLDTVQAGQWYECVVTIKLPRVIKATPVEDRGS